MASKTKEDLLKDIEALQAENTALKAGADKALQEQVKALEGANEALKSALDEKDKEISVLKDTEKVSQEKLKSLKSENETLEAALEEQHKEIEALESAATVKSLDPVVSHNGKNYEVIVGRVKFKNEWVSGKKEIAKNKELIAHLVKIESGALKLHKKWH